MSAYTVAGVMSPSRSIGCNESCGREGDGNIADFSRIPTGEVLIEAVCQKKHHVHVVCAARIPSSDRLVEGVCQIEHHAEVLDVCNIPMSDCLIETVVHEEHTLHALDFGEIRSRVRNYREVPCTGKHHIHTFPCDVVPSFYFEDFSVMRVDRSTRSIETLDVSFDSDSLLSRISVKMRYFPIRIIVRCNIPVSPVDRDRS